MTTKRGIEFYDEIKPINVSKMIEEIQENHAERNNYDWFWTIGDEKEVVKVVERIIEEADFYNIDYMFTSKCYWCGILTADPWNELNMSEEETLNLIAHNHIKVTTDKDGISLTFYPNTKSPLYKLFRKYPDGYGENISSGINGVIRKLRDFINKRLSEHSDDYGTWTENCDNEECEEEMM